MVGQRIGQYRVIERLGAGGMGHVFRAVDETLGRDVALKILDATTDNAAARLRSEAAALARISHPGIATVHELIEDDGRLVMVMEFVRGQTLQHVLEQVGVFAPHRAADLCMQTLAVLEQAHAAGVVHRDLKPGNLMIADSGSIKILDFGIARLNDSIGLTSAGMMLGTPAYMAPEQVLGHPVDARADLYAMGVVLFRLTTGALPFTGRTPFEMAQSQVNDAPMKASDVRPDLPAWVDEMLARALAKEPSDRFQSAAEFRDALTRIVVNEATPAIPVAAMEVTEVMARPDLPGLPEPPAPETVRQKKPPQRVSSVPTSAWVAAAAMAILIGGIWALKPSTTKAPDQVAPPPPSAVDTALPAPEPAAADALVITKVATTTVVPSTPAVKTQPPTSTPSAATVRPIASFNDVKSLAIDGSRAWTSDVIVEFTDTGVSVQSAGGKATPDVLSYHSISKATYAQSKNPKLDPALSHPAEKIDVPGIGVLSRSRHWFVLQGPDRYLILRLDGDDRLNVMKAFEERAGIVIDRSDARKQ